MIERNEREDERLGMRRRSFFFFGAILAAKPEIVVPKQREMWVLRTSWIETGQWAYRPAIWDKVVIVNGRKEAIMTKNTLAAALMAGMVGFMYVGAYVSARYPDETAKILPYCIALILLPVVWGTYQDLAQDIIEARRKRGEGTK